MKNISRILIKNKFLTLVLLGYLGVFIYKSQTGVLAIKNSAYYFKEMLVIMPVILLLTALLEAWVPKEAIEKHLGKKAGFKGQLFSFLLGSFSAGPIYAAFPVCIALLKKGASLANIVILLSTWAVVKIPMLANEAKFLSPKFMVIRWILTSVSILLIGMITAKFVKKEAVLALHTERIQREPLLVTKDYCIGCGICAKLSPAHFTMQQGKAVVLKEITPSFSSEEKDHLMEIAKKCPGKAITLQ